MNRRCSAMRAGNNVIAFRASIVAAYMEGSRRNCSEPGTRLRQFARHRALGGGSEPNNWQSRRPMLGSGQTGRAGRHRPAAYSTAPAFDPGNASAENQTRRFAPLAATALGGDRGLGAFPHTERKTSVVGAAVGVMQVAATARPRSAAWYRQPRRIPGKKSPAAQLGGEGAGRVAANDGDSVILVGLELRQPAFAGSGNG